MKKLIIALIIPLLFACSNDEETNPSFTENLTGSKYRAEAWYENEKLLNSATIYLLIGNIKQ